MFKDWLLKLIQKILAEFLKEGDKPGKLSQAQKDKLKAAVDKFA